LHRHALYRYIAWKRLDVPLGYGAATVDWGRGEPEGADLGSMDAVEFIQERRRSWGVRIWLSVDEAWRCDFALVNVLSRRPWESLTVERDGDMNWVVNGRRRRSLHGCVELDIAATPLTNTLAIRQLGLKVGEEAMINVAWVDVPSLRVTPVQQGYRRIGPIQGSDGFEAYEFWPVGGRTYRLTVDADALVVEYEDFAQRL
jgi:hypothetical protein